MNIITKLVVVGRLKEVYLNVTKALCVLQYEDIGISDEIKKIEKDLVGIQHRLAHEINLREV
ncbi:MAG: hypothetical protein L3J17_06080 [Candidatus Jettenia sp.]|nr:MAG: hypothetical protein L3J17_06080 [Candidatus Jettenia sp.]